MKSSWESVPLYLAAAAGFIVTLWLASPSDAAPPQADQVQTRLATDIVPDENWRYTASGWQRVIVPINYRPPLFSGLSHCHPMLYAALQIAAVTFALLLLGRQSGRSRREPEWILG